MSLQLRPPLSANFRTLFARACRVACTLILVMQVTPGAAGPPTPGRTIVDHAVVPAGGVCRGCEQPHCRGCQGTQRRHHGGCRAGHCHPHCPVRPQEFGFYETNWRRWPGSGVVPATNLETVTPVQPPKSEVPTVEEESATLPVEESPIPEEGAAFRRRPSGGPAITPPPRSGQEPLPPTESPAKPPADVRPQPTVKPQQPLPPASPALPVQPQPSARPQSPASPGPATVPSTQPAPGAKPPTAPEKDLFDESRVRQPALRRIAVSGAAPIGRPTLPLRTQPATPPRTAVQPTSLELPEPPEPPLLGTPQVPFDAAVEAARLRGGSTPRR